MTFILYLPPNLRLDKQQMDYKKLYEEGIEKIEELKKDHNQLIKEHNELINDEKPTSPTNDLCGMVFDIKDKLSDGEYKDIMDKLQIENKKSVLPKYVKLYHITGHNNIHQHTNCFEYKTNLTDVNYTWDTQDEKEDDEVELKRLDVNMVMKATTRIYEVVPHDELDGYYISSKYSKIRLNPDGELMSDIKVGSIINECEHVWDSHRSIFIIKELIY